MKRLLTILISLLFGLNATAQVFAGGSLSIAGHKSEKDSFSASLAPEVGYKFGNRWMLGAKASVSASKYSDESRFLLSSADVFGRYELYGMTHWGIWVDFGASVIGPFYSYSTYSLYAKPLLTYQAGKHFLFKSGLNFAKFQLACDYRDGKLEHFSYSFYSTSNDFVDSSNISIGVVYLF